MQVCCCGVGYSNSIGDGGYNGSNDCSIKDMRCMLTGKHVEYVKAIPLPQIGDTARTHVVSAFQETPGTDIQLQLCLVCTDYVRLNSCNTI